MYEENPIWILAIFGFLLIAISCIFFVLHIVVQCKMCCKMKDCYTILYCCGNADCFENVECCCCCERKAIQAHDEEDPDKFGVELSIREKTDSAFYSDKALALKEVKRISSAPSCSFENIGGASMCDTTDSVFDSIEALELRKDTNTYTATICFPKFTHIPVSEDEESDSNFRSITPYVYNIPDSTLTSISSPGSGLANPIETAMLTDSNLSAFASVNFEQHDALTHLLVDCSTESMSFAGAAFTHDEKKLLSSIQKFDNKMTMQLAALAEHNLIDSADLYLSDDSHPMNFRDAADEFFQHGNEYFDDHAKAMQVQLSD